MPPRCAMISRRDRQCAQRISRRQPWALCFMVMAAFPQFLRAQGLGTIAGNITDPNGALVPGAKVVVIQQNTGFSRTVTSDTQGHYVVPSLRPAVYTLTVEAQGFKTFTRVGITLLADETVAVNVQLEL